ncbi:MAG: prolyl oligopeptidase family serine peptidase [Chlamydiia bacterium]|nr:prolyl oligopeptidase family serine peptidase [Chlamydiia bacterium]
MITYAFVGPPLEAGPLPAFFYFSLSAEESLKLAPFNAPVLHLQEDPLRVFSFTIPGHGEGFDKHEAMDIWADWAEKDSHFLFPFFEKVSETIGNLIDKKIVDPNKMAIGGLSRGGFIATHIAAKEKRFSTLLGYAPLTRLVTIEEFQRKKNPLFLKEMEKYDLSLLSEDLLHLRHLRFYIGNRDVRVSTDACFAFIRTLSDVAYEKRTRELTIEMNITPSIGYKGHGTSDATFAEGANWIRALL